MKPGQLRPDGGVNPRDLVVGQQDHLEPLQHGKIVQLAHVVVRQVDAVKLVLGGPQVFDQRDLAPCAARAAARGLASYAQLHRPPRTPRARRTSQVQLTLAKRVVVRPRLRDEVRSESHRRFLLDFQVVTGDFSDVRGSDGPGSRAVALRASSRWTPYTLT